MRQTGVMAACAAYALTHNFPLLPGVHALAQRLEKGLEEMGVEIRSRAETCMVCCPSLFSTSRPINYGPERYSMTHPRLVWTTPRS